MKLDAIKFTGRKNFSFDGFDTKTTEWTADKEAVLSINDLNIKKLELLQDRFYAQSTESVLIVLQAMDAAGKDGAIKHVMTGLNPQGVDVTNFKQPSNEELSHDYLWRCVKKLPAKGKIGIFNRSYYEDVLIGKVHDLYKGQNFPERCKTENIFEQRYEQISNFEKYLWENGTRIIKFFFCISKEEQKNRFFKRINDKNKNWKLSDADIKERKYWDEYMSAYEEAINKTATPYAPWYVVPSDKKWVARSCVSEVLTEVMEDIDPRYPKVTKNKEKMVQNCKELLLNEK